MLYVWRHNRQHHSGSGIYAPDTSVEFQTCRTEVFVLLARIPTNKKTHSEPKYDRDDVDAGVRLQFDGIY